MGIDIAEQTETFHVPFGSPNSNGTPEASYVDVKAHPEWIPVLPSCLGWPETQTLLTIINSPISPFMSLAADQGFTWAEAVERHRVLTSFVAVCFADVSLNTKGMLKKAASGVLALLSCSRTKSTLRATKGLRPCWTDFFEHSPH
jgi:hypothetical protein